MNMLSAFRNSIKIFLYFSFLLVFFDLLHFKNGEVYGHILVTFISWLSLIYGILRFKLIRYSNLSSLAKSVIGVFLIWCVINILRSISIPLEIPKAIPRFLGDSVFAPAWLAPFYIFYGSNVKIWSEVWTIAKSFTRVFLILSPLLFFFSRYYVNLSFFVPLLILHYDSLEKRNKLIVTLAFFIACIYFVYHSERNLFVHFAFYPIVYYLFLFFRKIPQRLLRIVQMSSLLVLIIIFIGLLYNGVISKYISNPKLKENVEGYEKKNFNSSTRNQVYYAFFKDFVKPEDWIFGRGVLGTTYDDDWVTIQTVQDMPRDVFGFPWGYRSEIECGYLMYILKTGLIGLIIMLIIALRAIYKGFFNSNNYFVKTCALIIVQWLISMYPYAIPDYNLAYILFWLSIGACLSREMCNYSNDEIKNLIMAKVK